MAKKPHEGGEGRPADGAGDGPREHDVEGAPKREARRRRGSERECVHRQAPTDAETESTGGGPDSDCGRDPPNVSNGEERPPPATFKRLLGDSRTARALTALPAPHRLLTWPWRRQRGYMAPRLRHDIDQERAGDFRQAYEDGGIVAIVLSEEEGMWIQLHQDITLADPCQLKHENRVIVAESCEKPTIQEEGRHAIRPALRNVGKLKQQPARFNDAHAPPPGLGCLRLTRGHTSRCLTDRA